jgi:alcohol dehydrogenase (NADP+)
MLEATDFRSTKIPLNNGVGHMPALGFGTLIPDPTITISATKDALVAGFRQFDCAERYRNEREVAQGLQAGLAVAGIGRKRHLPGHEAMEYESSTRTSRTCV